MSDIYIRGIKATPGPPAIFKVWTCLRSRRDDGLLDIIRIILK